jgi:hypothetical protein
VGARVTDREVLSGLRCDGGSWSSRCVAGSECLSTARETGSEGEVVMAGPLLEVKLHVPRRRRHRLANQHHTAGSPTHPAGSACRRGWPGGQFRGQVRVARGPVPGSPGPLPGSSTDSGLQGDQPPRN